MAGDQSFFSMIPDLLRTNPTMSALLALFIVSTVFVVPHFVRRDDPITVRIFLTLFWLACGVAFTWIVAKPPNKSSVISDAGRTQLPPSAASSSQNPRSEQTAAFDNPSAFSLIEGTWKGKWTLVENGKDSPDIVLGIGVKRGRLQVEERNTGMENNPRPVADVHFDGTYLRYYQGGACENFVQLKLISPTQLQGEVHQANLKNCAEPLVTQNYSVRLALISPSLM